MPRTFPDTAEIHTLAKPPVKFDTSQGDNSATLVLKANGEADFLIESDGQTWPGTAPAPTGWGTSVPGIQRLIVHSLLPSGEVKTRVLEVDDGEQLLSIERDWHDEANPPAQE